MEKYEFLEQIGTGAYGKVFKARDTETNKLVAVKKTKMPVPEDGLPPTAIREISLLWALSEDKHIVKLLDVQILRPWRGDPIPEEPEPDEESNIAAESRVPLLYLIFERLDSDLKALLDEYRQRNERFSPKVVKEYMFQLLTGLCLCHSRGILHRDLKPQNILVDKENGFLKLADFGLGREYGPPSSQYTNEVVTLWYRAPELLLGSSIYSTPVDIWSMGCIFSELCRMAPTFPAKSEYEQLLILFDILGTPSEAEWREVTRFTAWHEYPKWRPRDATKLAPGLDDEGLDLLLRMLVYDPAKRISAKSALSHPYFRDLDDAFKRTHQLL